MRFSPLVLLGLLALLLWSRPAHAASSYDNCTGLITSVPAVISTPGTWCLKQDVTTSFKSGSAITISADNVILNCNDFRIDGSAAGINTIAVGVLNSGGNNNTVRRCNIRGYYEAVELDSEGSGGGNVVEDNHLDGNTGVGVEIEGEGSVVRRNVITNTGNLSLIAIQYFGVHVLDGTVDVIDNTINGVGSRCGGSTCGVGIFLDSSSNAGANVIGNRIGGLPAGTTGGIQISDGGRVVVRKNEIIGTGGSGIGVNCQFSTRAAMVRVHDNVIDGFATSINSCTDAGENDSSP